MLAACGTPVAGKCRVVVHFNKVKTALCFSIPERSMLHLIRSCTVNISTHYIRGIVKKISFPYPPSAGNSTDELSMWAERGISGLFFNIVPTDTDAFVPPSHELEEPLLVKVDILGPYSCLNVFIGGETAPFECLLRSREEVKFVCARSRL
jgi:hypothetical protein